MNGEYIGIVVASVAKQSKIAEKQQLVCIVAAFFNTYKMASVTFLVWMIW